jgi:hypothetical protein
MIIQKTDEFLLYFRHDGLTLELDQDAISVIGLVDLLKRTIKEKYVNCKSFSLSIIKENVIEIQISVLSDLNWKV